MRRSAVVLVLGAAACTGLDAGDDPAFDEPTSEVVSALASPAAWDGAQCSTAAGTAWANRFVAQRGLGLSVVEFIAQVGAADGPDVFPVDAAYGLASGRANAYRRLGPTVRFNPDGFVDARDGSSYAALTAFPYDTPHAYRIAITANLGTHRYDATITDVETGATAQIADDYAFRTEQSGMTRFDTIASKIDSAGAISTCEPTVSPPVCDDSSPGGSWKERGFPARTRTFQAELDLFMFGPGATDMVVGLAGAQVDGEAGLAAALRLGPKGTFAVRDGGVYRADAVVSYLPDTYRYRAIFRVNPVTKKYSVWIRRTETEAPVLIASGYKFRTEQASLAAFDRVAQYMQPVGSRDVQVCDLAVSY